jgi:hypothetical protein
MVQTKVRADHLYWASRLYTALFDLAGEELEKADRALCSAKIGQPLSDSQRKALLRAVATLYNFLAYTGNHECDDGCRDLKPFGHRSLDSITVGELLLDSINADDLPAA